ncbi:21448_t:CDS:2 [Cetraspora pellucida]|uniref:21448_t:CDS:1 n=1 Tax=Cetraspora pellucida TaxID=1433469 RepID=A0A9N9BXH2_9GLOM|nr:21448_t:CDS:2 [Cetraspora pellucida]
MSTLSGKNNQQEIYKDLPLSYDESQASAVVPVIEQIEMITEEIVASSEEKMSGNNITKNQLLVKVNELTAAFNKQKEHHINKISLYQTTFEKQKQEMKENHANEINIRKKHKYEYSKRLKNQEKTHKCKREERERNYKHETDLMQQTINRLEQTIRTLQTQINNFENVSTPELY